MAAAPCATFGRCSRMEIEEGLDLRHPRRRAEMTQVQRVDPHCSVSFGLDHGLECALLNAVLGERAVFRQHVVA